MKDRETLKIETLLAELTKNDYMTAEKIALDLGVSVKTARTRMAELNLLITVHGAEIISRPRFGYHLQINDAVKWDEYIRSRALMKEVETGTPEERTTFVALSLLMADDYLKISYFSDELFVSPQIVSASLKECEKIFSYFNLQLERKPYYGLKLLGTEFNKRNCIVSTFPNDFQVFLSDEESGLSSREVFEKVFNILQKQRIQLAEISLQSTAAYATLAIKRYRKGFKIDEPITRIDGMKDKAYLAALDIFQELAPEISNEEIYYFGVYISAMRSNNASEYRGNIIVTERIDALVSRIFNSINSVFGIDFQDNLRLHMMLAQHLISLDLRIRYHIPLNNDIYLNIRKDFPFAYSIANEALTVLIKEYATDISLSEADWLALIFATGLQDISVTQKLNVLVVCQEGRASSQLLKYQIRKNYANYVDNIQVCTIFELDAIDLSDFDYIFSTVNIPIHTNIPILMINTLSLQQRDSNIENELLSHRMVALDYFFKENLFFTGLNGKDKGEILADLCRRIEEVRPLPEGFYASLMERERLNSTDYSGTVAIPHPSGMIPEENIVAVAVLDKPVYWGRNNVQLIILTALSLKDEEATHLFYGLVTHFITDKKSVNALLKKPDYETFIALLSNVDLS